MAANQNEWLAWAEDKADLVTIFLKFFFFLEFPKRFDSKSFDAILIYFFDRFREKASMCCPLWPELA